MEINVSPKWHISGAYLINKDGVTIGRVSFDDSTITPTKYYDSNDVYYWEYAYPGVDKETNVMHYPTPEQYEVYNIWVYSLIKKHKMKIDIN